MEVIFVLSVMLLTVAYGAVNHDTYKIKSAEILGLELIGTADGSIYFYNQDDYMTWFEARTYCESFGLHLAVINTESQAELIKTAKFHNGYPFWTAGRDANELRQFTWEHNNSAPADFLKNSYMPHVEPLTCLTVIKSTGRFQLYTYACDFVNYSLCST